MSLGFPVNLGFLSSPHTPSIFLCLDSAFFFFTLLVSCKFCRGCGGKLQTHKEAKVLRDVHLFSQFHLLFLDQCCIVGGKKVLLLLNLSMKPAESITQQNCFSWTAQILCLFLWHSNLQTHIVTWNLHFSFIWGFFPSYCTCQLKPMWIFTAQQAQLVLPNINWMSRGSQGRMPALLRSLVDPPGQDQDLCHYFDAWC